MSREVVVIGAGIVGASAAWALLRDGHRVTVLDSRTPGGPQAASYGNGGWISPASVVPMSVPGLWRKVPRYLMDRDGPLTLRWAALPRLAPWLLRFLRAGATVQKVQSTARSLSTLLRDAPERHTALAQAIGHPNLIRREGLLYTYPDRAAFDAEALAWRLRRDNGIEWIELESEKLHRLEPALSDAYSFGALVEAGAHCTDPGGYVAAIVNHVADSGGMLRQAEAQGFVLEKGRLKGIRTDRGIVPCERAVVAAGVHSKKLAQLLADRIPLESERGYHAVISQPAVAPRIPIMPSLGKMAITPTASRLRISGQVELAHVTAESNWRRVEVLLRHALSTHPGLGKREDITFERWMGHRPSTSDGLPVIGPATASSDVVYAFGHGHVGLAAGPVTGQVVADLIGRREPVIEQRPFAAARFRIFNGNRGNQ